MRETPCKLTPRNELRQARPVGREKFGKSAGFPDGISRDFDGLTARQTCPKQRRKRETNMKAIALSCLCVSVSVWLTSSATAEPLPNTKPLTEEGDLAAKMVAGIHKYLDRELGASPGKRDELWKADLA